MQNYRLRVQPWKSRVSRCEEMLTLLAMLSFKKKLITKNFKKKPSHFFFCANNITEHEFNAKRI